MKMFITTRLSYWTELDFLLRDSYTLWLNTSEIKKDITQNKIKIK